MDKKKGIVHMCMDLCDMNKDCPKENYLTPFINHIIDECIKNEIFSFVDSFYG
jgi:hypothetical protein